jgi:SasC/Mrp/FmtB intercellular aggregation protein
MTFGNFVGVFNVPETISKLRFRFESTDNRTHEHPNHHRLLKGPNNYGGGLVESDLYFVSKSLSFHAHYQLLPKVM